MTLRRRLQLRGRRHGTTGGRRHAHGGKAGGRIARESYRRTASLSSLSLGYPPLGALSDAFAQNPLNVVLVAIILFHIKFNGARQA